MSFSPHVSHTPSTLGALNWIWYVAPQPTHALLPDILLIIFSSGTSTFIAKSTASLLAASALSSASA